MASRIYENKNSLIYHSDMHNYLTRQKGSIYIDKFNLCKYKYSPKCAGSKIFNKLPETQRKSLLWKFSEKSLKTSYLKVCF